MYNFEVWKISEYVVHEEGIHAKLSIYRNTRTKKKKKRKEKEKKRKEIPGLCLHSILLKVALEKLKEAMLGTKSTFVF